jgi:hypothetical protein
MGPSRVMRAVPLPTEVVISGSGRRAPWGRGELEVLVLVRIWVVRSMEPAAQSVVNSFARGKNLVVN